MAAQQSPSQTETRSLAALTAVGLDPFTVYRQMFAGPAECCWWYLGTLSAEVLNVGTVATSQVETLMACRFTDDGPDAFDFKWLELGVYRDIASGEIATPWFNPMTGRTDARRSVFQDGPAHYRIRRAPTGVDIVLTQPGAVVKGVAVAASIDGARVCLTQSEDKVRSIGSGDPFTIRTTLQIYADLADLRGGAREVKASGFYSVRVPARGTYFVTGLMQKAATDEKLNPMAWERLRVAYPSFFKGDRAAPDIAI